MKVYYLYNILDKFFPILTWNSFIYISPKICLDNDTVNSSTLLLAYVSAHRKGQLCFSPHKGRPERRLSGETPPPWSSKQILLSKSSQSQKLCPVWYHLHEMPKTGTLPETPSRLSSCWRSSKVGVTVFLLENPRDGGTWWAAIHGVAQSQTWLNWLSSSSS